MLAMREINECKAEILRRSQNRIIARRKKQKQITAVCSAFLICVVALCGVVLSQPTKKSSSLGTAGEINEKLEATEQEYGEISLEIISTYNSTTHQTQMSVKDIESVYNEIVTIFDNAVKIEHTASSYVEYNKGEGSKGPENYAGSKDENRDESTNELNEDGVYVLTFTLENGSTSTYRLDNNSLTDLNSDSKVKLPTKKISQIKALLGL